MDIQIYEDLYDGLESFLKEKGKDCYNPIMNHYEPKTSSNFPLVIFEEIRNNHGKLSFGDIPDKTSNLGYRVKIYAKTKGNKTKLDIARKVAQYVDMFLSSFGLRQVSFNPDTSVAEGDLYGIILMYNANFYNNRRKIIL